LNLKSIGTSINPMLELTKQQIRSRILARLKIQKEETRERKSKQIKHRLFRTKIFQKAKVVMFYIAFDGEVNTAEMIKAAKKSGKIVAVPVCKKGRVTLRPCLLNDTLGLKKGAYGICEPAVEVSVDPKDLGLVIVPGLAFDKRGARLGRGKGCFDRFLTRIPKRVPSIGLAFDFQILPYIPAKKHDVNVDRIIFA
jgi:5-formyltetrahydrofolate cyclo-ligase